MYIFLRPLMLRWFWVLGPVLALGGPAVAAIRVEYDAASAGPGQDPSAVSPPWTRYGTPMTHNGVYLLQDNTADDPVTQSGEYLSPSAGTGLMTYGAGQYGIEFRVRPRTDVPLLASSHYANLYVTWSDNSYTYNLTIDKDSDDAGPGTTGGLRYGQNSMANAVAGIDWSSAHTIFVGYRGSAGAFDFYVDGEWTATVAAASMARTGSFARDAVDFGDGTSGQGLDVAGEWYFVRVHDVPQPVVIHDPFADADGDGDVDQTDFAAFQRCLSGPGGGVAEGCAAFDRPEPGLPLGDNDVDAVDFTRFQECMSGPLIAAEPGCDDPPPSPSQNHISLYTELKSSQAQLDALIDQAVAHGVGTLVPSLSGGGGCVAFVTPKECYLAELSDELASGFDALARMIQAAHAAGLKVVPSIAVGPVNLLIFGHPEWETKDRNNQPSSTTFAPSLAFSYPQARQAKVAMLMDLVNNYAIDGIFLDYCRYPENTNPSHPEYACGFYGYDAPLIQQCLGQFGFDPRAEPVGSPNWNIFNGLRVGSVVSFLQEFGAAVATSGRNIPIGGFGDSTLANDLCAGRDWSIWGQGGHIDELWLGNYVVAISNMRQVLAQTRGLVGPGVLVHGALTPYAGFLTTNTQMVEASREMLIGGADRLWIYREDALTAGNLWDGAALANDKFIRMKKLTGTPLVQFDAAAAGAGIEPPEVSPAWVLSGSAAMTNNGAYLLQDNTVNPASETGAYQSPTAANTMKNATGNYAIELRVRPLTDIVSSAGSSAYANLHVGWSDDVWEYALAIDKDSDDAGAGATGGLRVGGAAMTSAVAGVSWATPHTVRISYDAVDGEFYFYLDNALVNALPDTGVKVGVAATGLRDRVAFGDSTTNGADAAAEWYRIRLDFNQYAP